MALKKKPVNGMKDIMPDEMQIRDYVQSVFCPLLLAKARIFRYPCFKNCEARRESL